MTCSLLVFSHWVFVLGEHAGSTASVSISFIYFWSFMCLNYNAWQVISQTNWSKCWLTRNEEKMGVSSVGRKVMIGQDSLRYAENTGNREGREFLIDGVRGLLQPWWALSCHQQNRTVSCASANKNVTRLSLLPVPLGMSGGWLEPLAVSAGKLQTGIV